MLTTTLYNWFSGSKCYLLPRASIWLPSHLHVPVQPPHVSLHVALLHFTGAAFFTNWRQDPPPAKNITSHLIATVCNRNFSISEVLVRLIWEGDTQGAGIRTEMGILNCNNCASIWASLWALWASLLIRLPKEFTQAGFAENNWLQVLPGIERKKYW